MVIYPHETIRLGACQRHIVNESTTLWRARLCPSRSQPSPRVGYRLTRTFALQATRGAGVGATAHQGVRPPEGANDAAKGNARADGERFPDEASRRRYRHAERQLCVSFFIVTTRFFALRLRMTKKGGAGSCGCRRREWPGDVKRPWTGRQTGVCVGGLGCFGKPAVRERVRLAPPLGNGRVSGTDFYVHGKGR